MYTYKAIDLNITKDDISIITSQVKSVSSDKWFFDEYRNCEILTLLDKNFNWSEAGEICSHFKKVYNEKIKPILSSQGKIHILKTKKGGHIPTHIDCKQNEIPEFHQKFRLALTGKLSNLYFLDKNNNKVYAPNYHTYILNGGHPHGLDPAEEKLTICLGSPWKGEDNYDNELYTMNVSFPKLKTEWIQW